MKFKPRKSFERDLARLAKLDISIINDVKDAVNLLLENGHLPAEYQEHALERRWTGYIECHLRDTPSGSTPSATNDVLMIYRWDLDTLVLIGVRVGSHHQLFNGLNSNK